MQTALLISPPHLKGIKTPSTLHPCHALRVKYQLNFSTLSAAYQAHPTVLSHEPIPKFII